ncbi:MAG: hypothetical protein P1U56_13885 [Saprospiraceae bacterium]|nr:hypothetical protein [Saprospiraceae bacterium]
MKNLFLLGLAIFIISCSNTFEEPNDQERVIIENEINTRSTLNKYETMDNVIAQVFNKDITTLQTIQENISNEEYSSSFEVLTEIGISEVLAEQFLSIDWSNDFDDEGQASISFVNGYVGFVCEYGTSIDALSNSLSEANCSLLINEAGNYSIALGDGFEIQGLFGFLCDDDPCSLCNTVNTVVSGALGFLSVIGTLNAVDGIISYAQDCG